MQVEGLRIIVLSAMMALSACAGGDLDRFASAGPPPPSKAAVEQARLQMVDRCMFDIGATAGAEQKIGPICQCYARGALRQMSPFEIRSVAAGGSTRGSVRGSEIYATCARSTNAFAESASRPRAGRPESAKSQSMQESEDKKKTQ